MQGTIRRVTRNVKRWRYAFDGASLGSRRHDGGEGRLPAIEGVRAVAGSQALAEHQARQAEKPRLACRQADAYSHLSNGHALKFNRDRDIPPWYRQ